MNYNVEANDPQLHKLQLSDLPEIELHGLSA